ncbi:MAG TPA: 16S rRNA (guanine(527)-N(7))-methyltransferase RsmG [Aestuariivirgaceae bacterium]|jgi:16S rRNA (guanine527-N7)-methyltransferase
MKSSGAAGADDIFARFNVSRESQARLKLYADLLRRWNAQINLVSQDSVANLWERHVADALQLRPYIEPARTIIDLGAGAGLPGLVLGLAYPEYQVMLIESNGKKASFLREVARQARISVKVIQDRIERVDSDPYRSSNPVITARAVAPLRQLLELALPFLSSGRGLFHKGRDVGRELTEATKTWIIQYIRHPSMIDPSGAILEILEVRRSHEPDRTLGR